MNTSVSHPYQLKDKICSFKYKPWQLYKEQAAWGSEHTIIHQTWTTGRSALQVAITFFGWDMTNTLHSQSQPSTKGIYMYMYKLYISSNHPVLQCSHYIGQWWYYFHRNMVSKF